MTAVRGRPREFDLDTALDAAVTVFWQCGYEGASMTTLTAAMGVNRPSLYAAFGTKRQLFDAALARYVTTRLTYVDRALAEPTARSVIETYLAGTVTAVTTPGLPRGCFLVQAALGVAPEHAEVARAVTAARRTTELALRRRLRRAARTGDLPAGVEPADLARAVGALSAGLAVQAAGGASRRELLGAVAAAVGGLSLPG